MIVFGSRGSDLALTQTRAVAEEVKARSGQEYRIEVLVTAGDRIQDQPLSGIGIKGLFTQELEEALRAGTIDAAVHSLKDLPVADPDGIELAAVPVRENPADVLVARVEALGGDAVSFDALGSHPNSPCGVGTSSPRRTLACRSQRPDLDVRDVRGNVQTRVDRVRRGDFDAVILAAAGLNRLGADLSGLVRMELPTRTFTPAPGQGALGIQCRRGDQRVREALATVHDDVTGRCVGAERAVLFGLGGGCSMPLGVLLEPLGARFRLTAALFGAAGDGAAALRAAAVGDDPDALAAAVVAAWGPLVGEPLAGLRVATIRPDGELTGLAAAMAIAGAELTVLPWTRTEAIAVTSEQLAAVLECDALAFASPRAARHFTAACDRHRIRALDSRAVAVGATTAAELVQLGYTNVSHAEGRGGRALAAACVDGQVGDTVGLPCAEHRDGGFEEQAAAAGIKVRPLPLYRTVVDTGGRGLPAELDAFLFTSPSAVDAFVRCAESAAKPDLWAATRALSIGATTSDALARAGVEGVVTLADPSPGALLGALLSGGRK